MMLDKKRGAEPMYKQLERIMKKRIRDGELCRGDSFPSERQLEEEFGVSRITVRQATALLEKDGYIRCSQGSGSIVAYDKIDEALRNKASGEPRIKSFSEEMALHGIVMETTECVMTRGAAAPEGVLQRLESDRNSIYRLTRVRAAGGAPIVYSVTYLCGRFSLPTDCTLYKSSLYSLLREKLGINAVHGFEEFEAVPAEGEVARKLQIPEGSAVFKRTRVTSDQLGQPIEFTVCFYNAEKYKYTLEL